MSATTAEDFKYSCSSQNVQANSCFGTDNNTATGTINFSQQLSHLLPPINSSHHQYPASSSSSSFLTSSYPLATPQNPLSQFSTATNTNGTCGGSFAALSGFSTPQPQPQPQQQQQQRQQGGQATAFCGGYGQTSVVGPDVADRRATKGANIFWTGDSPSERGSEAGNEARSTVGGSVGSNANSIPHHFKRSRFHGEYEGILVASSPNGSDFVASSSSHVNGIASGSCVSEGDAVLAAGMLPPPLQTIRGLEVEGFDGGYRGGGGTAHDEKNGLGGMMGAKRSQHNDITTWATENGNGIGNTCMAVPVSDSAAQSYVNDTHFLHIPPGTVGFEYYEPPLSRFRADTNRPDSNTNIDGGNAHITANSSNNSTNASGYRNPKEIVVVEASEYTRRGGPDCQSGSISPIPAGAAPLFPASTNIINSNNNGKAAGSSNSLPSASRSSVGYTSHACTPTPSPSAAIAAGPLGGAVGGNEVRGTSAKDAIHPHGLVPPPKPKSAHSAGDPRVWELTDAEAATLMGKAAGAELLKGEDDASAADFYLCRCAPPPIRKNPSAAGFPRDLANCYAKQENEEGAGDSGRCSSGGLDDEDDEATDNNNTNYTNYTSTDPTSHNSGANSTGTCAAAAAPTGSCENSSAFFDIKSGAEAKVQKCTCCGGWRLVVLSNGCSNSSSERNSHSARGYEDYKGDDDDEEEVLSPTSAASHKAVTAVIKSLITNRPMNTDSRILHKILKGACGIPSSSTSSGVRTSSAGMHCPTANNSSVFPCYPSSCDSPSSSSSGSNQQQPLLLTWSGVASREVPGRKRVRVTAVSTDPILGKEHTSHFVNTSYGPSNDAANSYFPIPSAATALCDQQHHQWSSQLHNGGGVCVSAAAGGIPIDGDEGFGFVAFKKNRPDGSLKAGFFPSTTNAPAASGRGGAGCDSDDVN